MKLSEPEFKAMSSTLRRWLQRKVEYPIFKRMGFCGQGADILEIGCGSGYGAKLIASQPFKSYLGIDLMPEQIALAQQVNLSHAEFRVADATNLGDISDESKDVVVIFGVLHHIPEWRRVVHECARVLRPGGHLFVEEPDGVFIHAWEKLIHWGHPDEVLRLRAFENALFATRFSIVHKLYAFGFGMYAAQKN